MASALQVHYTHRMAFASRRHHQPGQTPRLPHRRPAHSIFIDPFPGRQHSRPRRRRRHLPRQRHTQGGLLLPFAPGELVLADDSGLEVDALNGAPGVRSARFAADSGLVDSPDANDNTDVWNNMVLLQRLAGVPSAQRTARYRCALVAARDGQALTPPMARSKASSLKRPAAPAASATIRSSICPSSTTPWRKSTSKPSSRSAIAAAPSALCCPCFEGMSQATQTVRREQSVRGALTAGYLGHQ